MEKEKKAVAEGDVVMTQGDLKLTCDRAVFFIEAQEAYAQGRVKLYEKGGVFESEFLKYNFRTKKGSHLEGSFQMPPFYGKAETAERVSPEEYVTDKPYITTCDLKKPHYRVQSRSAKIFLGDRITARNVVFYVGNMPLLYLPFYSHSLRDNRMNVTIVPGYSREWGAYVLTAWRFYLGEGAKGWIHADYRDLKGFANGVDYKYETGGLGRGLFRYYYLDERDKVPGEIIETERYRVQMRHRWDITDRTDATLEYNYLTDEDVVKDYFKREYELDPQPKSIFSLIHTEPLYSIFLQAEKKTSLFIREVERLPELTLDVRRLELGNTNLYYKGETTYTNLNFIEANQWTGVQDTQRLDMENEISYQSKLPFFNLSFTPRAGIEETFYTNGVEDKDFLRTSVFGGWDLTTKFYRIYEVEGDFMNVELHRLRHVITPRIEYHWIHEPTVSSSRLLQFDEVDNVTEEEFYTILLENKLQTKRPTGAGGKMENTDLAILTSAIDYFPKINEGEFSNLRLDFDFNPYRWLSFLADGEYNTY
ncbi:MAG: LPS-assembly protein LptD, partial [Candidatus Omnitrophica bacterium]|nr:LPS-assembly protein LptD [Candidatus Omnitrophota bacterium]